MEESDDNEFGKILDEVRRQYYEYEHQRVFCIALKDAIEKKSKEQNSDRIEVWLEPEIIPTKKKQNQKYKTPDMLMRINSCWLVLDYKEITSTDEKTLQSHLNDMSEYSQEFTFNHGQRKRKMFTDTFTPQVALLCPEEAATVLGTLDKLLGTTTVFSIRDGSTITMKKIVDKLAKDKKKLFDNITEIAKDTVKLATIKFLRHDPPLSYVTLKVYETIPQADPTDYSDPIETTVEAITEKLVGFYPGYLKTAEGFDIQQITEGRVMKALQFLKKIGFVKLAGNKVMMKRSAGKTVGDRKVYFTKKEAEKLSEERRKKKEKRLKEEAKKETKVQGTLEPWLS